jgi:hypothetical protein
MDSNTIEIYLEDRCGRIVTVKIKKDYRGKDVYDIVRETFKLNCSITQDKLGLILYDTTKLKVNNPEHITFSCLMDFGPNLRSYERELRCLLGELHFRMRVKSDDRIFIIKAKIEEDTTIPDFAQKLIYRDCILSDEHQNKTIKELDNTLPVVIGSKRMEICCIIPENRFSRTNITEHSINQDFITSLDS